MKTDLFDSVLTALIPAHLRPIRLISQSARFKRNFHCFLRRSGDPIVCPTSNHSIDSMWSDLPLFSGVLPDRQEIAREWRQHVGRRVAQTTGWRINVPVCSPSNSTIGDYEELAFWRTKRKPF